MANKVSQAEIDAAYEEEMAIQQQQPYYEEREEDAFMNYEGNEGLQEMTEEEINLLMKQAELDYEAEACEINAVLAQAGNYVEETYSMDSLEYEAHQAVRDEAMQEVEENRQDLNVVLQNTLEELRNMQRENQILKEAIQDYSKNSVSMDQLKEMLAEQEYKNSFRNKVKTFVHNAKERLGILKDKAVLYGAGVKDNVFKAADNLCVGTAEVSIARHKDMKQYYEETIKGMENEVKRLKDKSLEKTTAKNIRQNRVRSLLHMKKKEMPEVTLSTFAQKRVERLEAKIENYKELAAEREMCIGEKEEYIQGIKCYWQEMSEAREEQKHSIENRIKEMDKLTKEKNSQNYSFSQDKKRDDIER